MSQLKNAIINLNKLRDYAENETFLHKLCPETFILTNLFFIITVASISKYDISRLLIYLTYPALLMLFAEIPFIMIFKRIIIALPFAFFAGFTNIFFEGIKAGSVSLLVIIIKTFLCVSTVILIPCIVSERKLILLLNRLHVPNTIIFQFSLTTRYISVLMEEAANMIQSYILRSNGQHKIFIKHTGSFLGHLILRSLERAERIYNSMQLRGFNKKFQFTEKLKLTSNDVLYFAICVFLILLLRIFNFSEFLGEQIF